MSPRLLRLDANRIDALVFRSDSVRFEACATYRGTAFSASSSDDAELCECGWLEADHLTPVVGRRQFADGRSGRRAVRRTQRAAERQTA